MRRIETGLENMESLMIEYVVDCQYDVLEFRGLAVRARTDSSTVSEMRLCCSQSSFPPEVCLENSL